MISWDLLGILRISVWCPWDPFRLLPNCTVREEKNPSRTFALEIPGDQFGGLGIHFCGLGRYFGGLEHPLDARGDVWRSDCSF